MEEDDFSEPINARRHDGHTLNYYMSGCSTTQDCYIDANGDVVVTSAVTIDEIDDSGVWCATCRCEVFSSDEESGLSEDWQVV